MRLSFLLSGLYRTVKFLFKQIAVVFNGIYNSLILYLQNVEKGTNIKLNGRLYLSNKGKLVIGDFFRANSGKDYNPIGGDIILRLVVKRNAKLNIGDNVGISNSTIVCWESVTIGNNVFIGGGCKIWDTDFHSINPIDRVHNGDRIVKVAPVEICDYAFIGGGSIILKGVRIGRNSIVAAGSVVSRSIPDNEIWGGNPATKISTITI